MYKLIEIFQFFDRDRDGKLDYFDFLYIYENESVDSKI